MAEADDEGIPLEDYIKVKPEPHRAHHARPRRNFRYTWVDCQRQRPLRATTVACSRRKVGGLWCDRVSIATACGVRGWLVVEPRPSLRCFSSRCIPRQRLSTRRKKLPAGGVPVRHRWFWKKQSDRLQSSDRASHISRGRENFLAGLSDWLRNTHPRSLANGSTRRSATIFARRENVRASAGTLVPAKIISLSRLRGSVPNYFGRKNALSEQE